MQLRGRPPVWPRLKVCFEKSVNGWKATQGLSWARD